MSNQDGKARELGTGNWVFGTLKKLEHGDIDLDTVCMYTGKLDIYENDLIKVGGDLGQVFADTELEVWGIEFTDGTAVCLDEFDEASLKVVGNIFDD